MRPSYRTSPDHPRSRGVYAIFSFRAHKNEGSSPLARGLRLPRPTRGGRYGIIPARAGFTPLSNCVLNELEGSSPLARGLRDGGREHAAARRIIPARAGFTSPPNRQVHRRTDHPRSRGVYSPSSWRMPRRVGSSPLARGLHIVRVANLTVIRIIPARAGFTSRSVTRVAVDADHPRSRGVYRTPSSLRRGASGSSPLARGLHGTARQGRAVRGIIPARAGFTRSHAAWEAARRDHPRSRGVYQRAAVGPPLVWGSSPLARGLLERRATSAPQLRIIPARAGFTRWAKSCLITIRDHPRSRGVYGDEEGAGCRVRGSSPLARGLLDGTQDPGGPVRIIPARAGFTCRGERIQHWRGDHPRSRGVYRDVEKGFITGTGSSPLARGLQHHADRLESLGRIIPARAGFTVA